MNSCTIPEKRIIFIRHGQSKWNEGASREPNDGLSELGFVQSSTLTFNLDLVICSCQKRACETLANSHIKCKEIMFTNLCREVDTMDMYAIETENELQKRIKEFKDLLTESFMIYNNICVISHKNFLKQLTNVELKNCEYVTMILKNQYDEK
jgi:broad specificity phosphatase PhoE